MKNYTVTWHHSAQTALANLFLNDPDPNGITDSANEIDRHLAFHPTHQAIAVEDGCFELAATSLSVVFRVAESDRRVEVLRVRRI
jgi:hypothetical protein